jgi:hypothetical protein
MNYNTRHNLGSFTVRLADNGDSAALVRLAGLDSAAFPEGPTLVAEVDGEIQAALPVSGGPAIADPFRATTKLLEVLRLRAEQLRGDGPKPGRASVYARAVSALRDPAAT